MSMFRAGFIMVLDFFALGITLPMMNVVLLSKGLTLSTLALFMALYSGIIVATEIPSGYLSDRIGRIPMYLIAKLLTFFGMVTVFVSHSLFFMFGAAVLLSLARSCSSGSFEAVVVDWHKETYGTEKMHQITTMMSVWETLGLSSGALASGFVARIFTHLHIGSDGRAGVFLISALMQVVIIILTVQLRKTLSDDQITGSDQISVKQLLSIAGEKSFASILILIFALGIILSSIELYWQPVLLQMIPGDDLGSILLGIVAFIGFMGALVGSLLAGKLIGRWKKGTSFIFVLLRLLLALSFVLLALTHTELGFFGLYALFYIFVAMSGVVSGTIVNTRIPSALRSSLLSTASFALQIGGLAATLFASAWLSGGKRSIRSLWIIYAVLSVCALIPFFIHEIRGKGYREEVTLKENE